MALSTRQFAQTQRLHFIEQRLYWEGRINRADLVEAFGISTVQASSDLNDYLRDAPDSMWYDKSGRVYRAAEDFHAGGVSAPGRRVLALRAAGAPRRVDTVGPASGTRRLPAVAQCDVPTRALPAGTLRALLRQIQRVEPLRVHYHR